MANSYVYLLLHYQNHKRRNAQVMLIAQEMIKSMDKKNKKNMFILEIKIFIIIV